MRSRIFLLLAISALSAVNMRANHRKLTAVPRATGRTAKNMVLFKDKQAALEEWGALGMALADGFVTHRLLTTVPNMAEGNPFLGKHPSLARLMVTEVASGMAEAGLTQYGHEAYDNGGSHWVQHSPIMFSSLHVVAAFWNEHLIRTQCSQAGIVCR